MAVTNRPSLKSAILARFTTNFANTNDVNAAMDATADELANDIADLVQVAINTHTVKSSIITPLTLVAPPGGGPVTGNLSPSITTTLNCTIP